MADRAEVKAFGAFGKPAKSQRDQARAEAGWKPQHKNAERASGEWAGPQGKGR